MPTYNPNDFYPGAGKEINSQGNVVNPADGVDSSGNQGVDVNGRGTSYQRVLVNQSLAANGNASVVINCGLGTKSVNAGFKSTGSAYIGIFACDVNGNPLNNGSLLASSASGGSTASAFVLQDYGGAPYFAIYAFDKSAAANTIQYIDVWWTKG